MKRRRSDLEKTDKVIENLKKQLTDIKIFKEKFQDLLLDYESLKWNSSRLEEFSYKILIVEEELEKLNNYKKLDNEIIFLCEINNEINTLCNKITAKIGAITQKICDFKNNFIFDSKYV
ncbi:unnamed protein product [Blepharisma stoltei]|uniref:Uncharacterized protein n=1 Tax=Blepharisma stoltei TaxID=1481888 RepID=A0AAU9K6Q3_9CILI|nr:unnamed protein product [Blepharisma stoltei]